MLTLTPPTVRGLAATQSLVLCFLIGADAGRHRGEQRRHPHQDPPRDRALRERLSPARDLRARPQPGSPHCAGAADDAAVRGRLTDDPRRRAQHRAPRHPRDPGEGPARARSHRARDVGRRRARAPARAILIATGSSAVPGLAPAIPFDDPDVHDPVEILGLDRIRKSLLVVGGGAVGCEYASIFAALGVEVTLIEPRRAASFATSTPRSARCSRRPSTPTASGSCSARRSRPSGARSGALEVTVDRPGSGSRPRR